MLKSILYQAGFVFFLFASFGLAAQVQISEYSASNLNDFVDDYGKYEDWVELYNTSNVAVDLSGWYLSDRAHKPQKWSIPEGVSIAPGGYVIFWCSSRDTVAVTGYHTNFKLTQTKGDEVLMLSTADGTLVDEIPLELTLLGHSRLRLPNSDQWVIALNPSPGNVGNTIGTYQAYTQAPSIDLEAGFYNEPQTVSVIPNDSGQTIRYTTDGTLPNENSPIYTTPLIIEKTTVVKARTFSDLPDVLPGKIVFNTYFIDEHFSLPVYSVAADQVQDLANGEGTLRPHGSIEYFDVNQNRVSIAYGELNRHGQDSWVNPHRSLDWVSRDEMGYAKAVFGQLFSYSDRLEHQRLMFRASGDDNYPATNGVVHDGSTHVRDEYVHTLALDGGMELDVRAVERVILFLDGNYWGVYGLRERPVDHDYTKEYYDQDKFHLQYLLTWGNSWAEYGGEQAFQDWGELRDFILFNDMGDSSNYAFVESQLNLLSLIDYMLANLNSVASDWLNYNTGWWRGLYPDGGHKKWGYILWDNDATFDYYINYSGIPNTQADALPCDLEDIAEFMEVFFDFDDGQHEKIFLKLQQESPIFRQLYYARQSDLINTIYSCENMLSTLDRMIGKIAPEMPRQIERWGGSMEEWQQNVAQLRAFIEQRCDWLDDGMLACYEELTEPYDLTLLVEPAGIGVGEIDFNTLDIESFPWDGQYFGGMVHTIKAKSFLNQYEFLHWKSSANNVIYPDPEARKATIELTQSDTLTAVFGIITSDETIDHQFDLAVFPNPTQGPLALRYTLETAGDVELSLYSSLGTALATFPEAGGKRQAGVHLEQLDLTELALPAGLYLLRFKKDQEEQHLKITVW
ncbi:MAG: CotH kinase family protein [Bacteroidota bacterium]